MWEDKQTGKYGDANILYGQGISSEVPDSTATTGLRYLGTYTYSRCCVVGHAALGPLCLMSVSRGRRRSLLEETILLTLWIAQQLTRTSS